VAVYRSVSDLEYFIRPLGSTELFGIARIPITVTYDFVRPGSFAPVVSYFYGTFNRDSLTVGNFINFTYSVPFNLRSTPDVDAEQFRLSAAPNPATELVNVTFEQPTTAPAQLSLF
jgi:hypothetical protein